MFPLFAVYYVIHCAYACGTVWLDVDKIAGNQPVANP